MIKSLVSNAEIEELCEGLVQRFIAGMKPAPTYIDIDGFITRFLRVPLEYADFAEGDKDKIGFVSDGVYPLKLCEGGVITERVYPRNTIVIDRLLLKPEENGRRRFTIAHEAAHILLDKISPTSPGAAFHRIFDGEQEYDAQALARRMSLNEYQANVMAAALLMPRFLVAKTVDDYLGGSPIPVYGTHLLRAKDKLLIHRMAEAMGVSFKALLIRLRGFGLLEYHDITEYIETELNLGGN